MENARKTGNDYRKELKGLRETMKSLDSHVTNRLLELVRIYPDAIIEPNYLGIRDDVKAKSLNKSYVLDLPIDKQIDYIQMIEKWSAEQSNVKQKKLEI